MGKRARLPELDDEPQSPLAEAFAALGGTLARNPVLVGGTTAFIVALSYVSANAIWYQPHFHSGAFFATRDNNYVGPPDPAMRETTIRIERPGEARPAPKPDPVVEKVQAVLKSMNLYEGEVDGLNGPNTRSAIAAYRKTIGLAVSGEIDEALLEQLGAGETTAGITPEQPAAPEPDAARMAAEPAVVEEPAPIAPLPERPQTVSARSEEPAAGDPIVKKIQAGLKAFGNDSMEIDGVIGSRTKSAIREFQSLFGLPVTGEPSEELYAKMREIGLVE
jgi:peptidoglycan hydrolase-like protein with peptidoglycan-binding domain